MLDLMLYAAVAIVFVLPIWWAFWIYQILKSYDQADKERQV